MTFYHIRYNIYPEQGGPVEKEDWLALTTNHNEQQLKRLLINSSGTKVSIILHHVICEEEYRNNYARASHTLEEQTKIDETNLNEWRLDSPAQILNQLNDEAIESDHRYRNISKPDPLL